MDTKFLEVDNRVYLGQLFKLAFGDQPVYIPYPLGKAKPSDLSGYTPQTDDIIRENDSRLSTFHTPIVFPIKFIGKSYRVYNDKGRPVYKQFGDFWLPPTTMTDFARAKNIVKTNILGSNGTVKEIYGFDDWAIRLRTLCLQGDKTPQDYLNELVQWSEIIEPIEVSGELFIKKKVYSLVIENIDIRSLVGSPGAIPIEITAVSDQAIELILND